MSMGIKSIVVDAILKAEVASMSHDVPGDAYREHVTGETPFCMMYTRQVSHFQRLEGSGRAKRHYRNAKSVPTFSSEDSYVRSPY